MLKIAEETTIKVSASSSPAMRTTVKDGTMAHARVRKARKPGWTLNLRKPSMTY